MSQLDYDAKSFVYQIYPAHERADFDYYMEDFFAPAWLKRRPFSSLFALIRPYIVFLWLLQRFDVFHFFFDGGFLMGTPLQYFEVQLLHMAGKKVVVMPYGGDVAVLTNIQSLAWRQGLMKHYPRLGWQEAKTKRWVQYLSSHADFVIGCIFLIETMPRWDMLTTHYYPIDMDLWTSTSLHSHGNGKDGQVTVVHAPNHRQLKGSDFLIAACQELRDEGYQISLRLLERVSNEEVRRVMSESDIVVDQFINGYGLTAMEGMSVGKPVMANLSDDHYYQVHRLYTGLDECPIVNTAIDEIKDNLRMLITQPELRKELGEAGRQYVLKYHSYEAISAMWDMVYRKLWYGDDLDLSLWHPDRTPAMHGL